MPVVSQVVVSGPLQRQLPSALVERAAPLVLQSTAVAVAEREPEPQPELASEAALDEPLDVSQPLLERIAVYSARPVQIIVH